MSDANMKPQAAIVNQGSVNATPADQAASVQAAQWESQLAAAGVRLAAALPSSASATASPSATPAAGWAIRLLAGIGGFIGGVMILLFLGMGLASLKLFDSPATALVIGLLLCAAAVTAYRVAANSAALEQFGLAVSVAGQLSLAIAINHWFKTGSTPSWWPLVLMQGLLLVLISNGLHRTLLTAAMVILGSLSCRSLPLVAAWWSLIALAAVLWLHAEGRLTARGRTHSIAPPVFGAPVFGAPVFGAPVFGAPVFGAPVFGAMAGLIVMQWPQWFVIWGRLDGADAFSWFTWFPLHWAAALPALLLAAWLHTRHAAPAQRAAALAFALAAGAPGVWLPAWTAALLLALLGLTSARPGWAVVALLAMIWSVSRFYYDMRITLLEKAVWMAAAGAVCLLLAALVHWIAPRLAAGTPGKPGKPGASTARDLPTTQPREAA